MQRVKTKAADSKDIREGIELFEEKASWATCFNLEMEMMEAAARKVVELFQEKPQNYISLIEKTCENKERDHNDKDIDGNHKNDRRNSGGTLKQKEKNEEREEKGERGEQQQQQQS